MSITISYKEALDYLYSQLPMFSRTGAAAYKPGLDTSIKLAEFFDNPHKKFRSIHIGGTNGKGSTSHMLASILQQQGYKTGLYTSPHLVDFRERIRINGEMIPREKVVEFVEEWKRLIYDGHPSFFELTMILAFKWFAEEKVDYAVIEVGMGGRLDSTNIISPMLSVITNISYDHNQFLGETLKEIAGEKAGIIKKDTPVVIGETSPDINSVFVDKTNQEEAPIIFAEELAPISIMKNVNGNGYCINYSGMQISMPLGGDYQKKNINTVIAAVEQLKRLNVKIEDETIKAGIERVIKNTGLQGRWMILEESPLTIADTGHNIAGLTYNFNQLKELMATKKGKLRIVIGFVADKAIDKILKILPKEALYYITNAGIPRAMPAQILLEKIKGEGLEAEKYADVKSAYLKAKREASEDDIIFIGGSTFVVADLLA